MRPRILSAEALDAWVEVGGLGFVAFGLRVPPTAAAPEDGLDGSLLVFAIDLQNDRVIGAQVGRIDTHGQIQATRTLYEEPSLFELACRSGGDVLVG